MVNSEKEPSKLLMVRRGSEPWRGLWTNPAGKVEDLETLEDAARREILEETGLEARIVKHLCTFDEFVFDSLGRMQTHYVCVNYLAVAEPGTAKAGANIADAKWMSLQEARSEFDNDLIPPVTTRPFLCSGSARLRKLFSAKTTA